jgi:hypothetical protein
MAWHGGADCIPVANPEPIEMRPIMRVLELWLCGLSRSLALLRAAEACGFAKSMQGLGLPVAL